MTWSPWVMGVTNEAPRSLVVFLQISEGCAHLLQQESGLHASVTFRASNTLAKAYYQFSWPVCLTWPFAALWGLGDTAEQKAIRQYGLFMLRPHIQLCDHSLQIHLHTTLVFLSFVANHNGFDWFLYQLDTSDFKACVVCHNCHGIAIATWEVGSLFFFSFSA